jgi:hypothetical protein
VSKIIDFYSGQGKNNRGLTIQQVWEFDDIKLERYHDYIQWLFPLDVRSKFNKEAPILTDYDIKQFAGLGTAVKQSLIVMLDFYGFTYHSGLKNIWLDADLIMRQRREAWVTASNHNYLRITRILKFLSLIGRQDTAMTFLYPLLALWKDHPFTIGESAIHWCNAISLDARQQSHD